MPALPIDTLKQISSIWRRLSAPGRIAVTATILLAVGGLLAVTFWARTPNLVVLESGLDTTQASKIADALDDFGIYFETRDRSSTILVDSAEISRARLKLAGQGLVARTETPEEVGSSPFETEAEKKARQTRRLQQDLARSIVDIDGIEAASVVISPGNESPYARLSQPPKAFAHIRTPSGRSLSPGQIEGIVLMIVSGVPGLTEDGVAVMGPDGRPLNRRRNSGDEVMGGTDAESYRANLEYLLEGKLGAMLDGPVGPGHYQVAVTVLLNFDTSDVTETLYDEEGKVLRKKNSQKTTDSSAGGRGGVPGEGSDGALAGGTPGKSETKDEEWDVPATITRKIKQTPEILRITASVTIDSDRYPGDEEELKPALRNAIGITSETETERGDEITVKKVAFAEIAFPAEQAVGSGFGMDKVLDILQYAAAGLVGLGLLIFFRSILKAKPGATLPAKARSTLDLTVGDEVLPEEQVSPKILERKKVKKEIARAIDQDPRGVAKLVEMWLHEEGA